METDMIELTIQISDIMSYNLKIPREINSDAFSEIMKRLRVINTVVRREEINDMVGKGKSAPKLVEEKVEEKIVEEKKEEKNPLMRLSLGESEEVVMLYKTSQFDEFSKYIENTYNIAPMKRQYLSHLIWKLKKRIEAMREGNDDS